MKATIEGLLRILGNDVLIVFELEVSEEDKDELLAVYLASFQRGNMENLLSEMGEGKKLAFISNESFSTNIDRGQIRSGREAKPRNLQKTRGIVLILQLLLIPLNQNRSLNMKRPC